MEGKKRKKVVLSIEDKLNALKRLDNGESIQKVSLDLGVGRQTVGDWKKNRLDLEKWSSNKGSSEGLKIRKTMKKCEYEKVSEALFLWFTQQRDKGVPITGPVLQEKAQMFQKEFNEGESDFSASVGWLDRWKKRYGVRQLNICGEKLSANPAEYLKFKEELHLLIDSEGLTGDQLFNCDETGLNYKLLISKTLSSRGEKSAPGYKKSKERVTVLACSNATGNHKMRLTFVGKPKKPRAFKNLSVSALPVLYQNQKSAWMDTKIFKNWFFTEFVPSTEKFLKSVNLPRKAVLVLDNAPSHSDEEDLRSGDIRAVFLPPNVTSLCQPMDQGVLENLKRNYRRRLLTKLLESTDKGEDMLVTLEKINLKDVIYWVAQAWEDVGTDTIARSWHKLLSVDECVVETAEVHNEDDLLSLLRQFPNCSGVNSGDIDEWMKCDENQELADTDIVALVNREEGEDEDDDVMLAQENLTQNISHSEGLRALETAITYAEQQVETTSADIMLLRRLRDLAAKKRNKAGKQTLITSFFN